MPPRHFWRRLFATIIDWLIAGLISSILLWPFLGDRSHIRLDDANLSFTNCFAVTNMGPELAALFPGYRITGGTACDHYTFFVYNGQSLNLSAEQNGTNTKTMISFPVTFSDDNFVSVTPIEPQSPISLVIFILGSAAFLTFATGTPGKRLFGLYVEPDAPFHRLLKRETLRSLPFIVGGIAQLPDFFSLQTASPAVITTVGVVQIAVLATASALALLLWIIPLIRWRGAMPHDRATGLRVTRA